jgi:excisionase family DNA binding protein
MPDPTGQAAEPASVAPAAVAIPPDLETLSLDQVGAILGLHRKTVERLALRKQLPGAFTVCRRVRVRAADLRKWIQDGCPRVKTSNN